MKPIYSPNDNEIFMNESQVEYFKVKLLEWKNSILEESKGTIEGMQQDTRNIPDSADRASEETDRALECIFYDYCTHSNISVNAEAN